MTENRLNPITKDIWELREDLFAPGGIHFPLRMVILEHEGELVLHSPVALTDDDAASIESLGTVKHIIAPSLMHHLFVGAAIERWPEATLWAPEGLAAKRPDLVIDRVLDATSQVPGLRVCAIDGSPFQERVFFHEASRSLIVTDLVFNIREVSNFRSQLVFRYFARAWRELAQSRLWRYTCKDRDAFAASAQRLLSWDFERVIMAHGEVCENDAHREMTRALDWMLSGKIPERIAA